MTRSNLRYGAKKKRDHKLDQNVKPPIVIPSIHETMWRRKNIEIKPFPCTTDEYCTKPNGGCREGFCKCDFGFGYDVYQNKCLSGGCGDLGYFCKDHEDCLIIGGVYSCQTKPGCGDLCKGNEVCVERTSTFGKTYKCEMKPTPHPSVAPSNQPTFEPTSEPTHQPTFEPTTREPTHQPTVEPTREPTHQPTLEPTGEPTPDPTMLDTTCFACKESETCVYEDDPFFRIGRYYCRPTAPNENASEQGGNTEQITNGDNAINSSGLEGMEMELLFAFAGLIVSVYAIFVTVRLHKNQRICP